MAKSFKIPKINLSVQLLGMLAFALLFGNKLPLVMQQFLFAISLSLKGLLLFILPLVIFSCLFSCLLTFRGKKAVGFMLLLFLIVCISNYISTMIAFSVGSLDLIQLISFSASTASSEPSAQELMPIWDLIFPSWLPNDYALYLGFALGSFFSFYPNPMAYKISDKAKHLVTAFLEKAFIPVLPLFALGFILKMQYDGILVQIMESYLPLIGLIILTYCLYLILLFAVAANFNLQIWKQYLKNIIPVALTGFTTMSSLATMPVTLTAAEKNTGNINIARVVIPATVNVHMVGVSIAVPLMAFSILINFGMPLPTFYQYCLFAFYFVITQFTVAAIPGGGILVMLPILESHLGFTPEMSALITILYILFDPVITVTNVLGNSALVIMISKWLNRFVTTDTAVT